MGDNRGPFGRLGLDRSSYTSDNKNKIQTTFTSVEEVKTEIEKYIEANKNDKKKLSQEDIDSLNKLKENPKKLSPQKLYEQFKEMTTTPTQDFTEKVVKNIMADKRFKNLQNRTILEGIGSDISKQLNFFTSKTDKVSKMLEDIVTEIVNDKIKIKEMEQSKQTIERDLQELANKFENVKTGYQRVLKDNEDLMKLNQAVIDQDERNKTELQSTLEKNKKYQDLTRNIFESRNRTQKKLQRMTGLLGAIDGAMGRQLLSFSETEAINPDLLSTLDDDLSGGSAKNHLMEKKILQKLDSDDVKDIEILSAFFNNQFKTKTELHTLLFALEIPFETKNSKKELLNKVIAKTKKLSKKDVEYIKNLL